MKIEFLIPVTDLPGYRRITSYKKHPKLRISSVTVGRTDHKSHKSLTEDFDALIDAQSALALEGLSDGTCYRMVLNEKIVSGESWKVPVALSHAALQQGISDYFSSATGLPDGEPEMVVWSTGAYEFDLTLDTQRSYDIEAKLKLFRPEAQRLLGEGKRLLIFLPPHQATLVSSDIGKSLKGLGAEFHVIATLKEGLDRLTLSPEEVGEQVSSQREPKQQTSGSGGKTPLALVASLLVVVAVGAGGLYWKDGLAFYQSLSVQPASPSAAEPQTTSDDAPDPREPSAKKEIIVDNEQTEPTAKPVEDTPPEPEAKTEADKPVEPQPDVADKADEPVPSATPSEPEDEPEAKVQPYEFYLIKSANGASCINALINPNLASAEPVEAAEDGQFTLPLGVSVCGIGIAATDKMQPRQLASQIPPTLLQSTMPPFDVSRASGTGPQLLLFFKRQQRPTGAFHFPSATTGNEEQTPSTVTITLTN
ncbi:hypothetical protein [uncultured Cohaesibacter sp.]|uniref:hypothetical protein n=1 Tax=uncultured Cohaesibacter sp. TaxID=1002546 RepID=UPI0029C6AA12|nr:hypothetical protein [uncultured Cohaesibacter sp.]